VRLSDERWYLDIPRPFLNAESCSSSYSQAKLYIILYTKDTKDVEQYVRPHFTHDSYRYPRHHHRVIRQPIHTHVSDLPDTHTTTKLALSHTRPSGRDAAAAPSPPTLPQLRKKSTRSSRPAPLSRSSTQEKLKRSARENARQAERREESEESFYDYWYV
jgi:hypothetical protein